MLIASPDASSQNYDYENPCRTGWGIRANIDINVPGHYRYDDESVKMFRNGAGINVAAVYTMPLAGSFFFQPGAGLFYDTYRFDNIIIADSPETGRVTEDPAVRKIGVRVPMMFGYNFNLWEKAAVAVYTGPELSYAFSGKVDLNKDLDWGDMMSENIFGGFGQRRFDVAWKTGVGIPMNHWYVGLEAAFGMLDLMRTDVRFHENRVSLSLGYNF